MSNIKKEWNPVILGNMDGTRDHVKYSEAQNKKLNNNIDPPH